MTIRPTRALCLPGCSKAAPASAASGFEAIRMRFELDTDAPAEQLDTLLRLTERYCVVYQTLASPPALSVTRQKSTGRGSADPNEEAP